MGILFDVGSSETRTAAPDGRRRAISGLSLENPAGADGQRVVSVWAEDGGNEKQQYAIATLSLEQPILTVQPEVVVGDELVLRHDAAGATVRFYGRVLSEEYVTPLDEEEEVTALDGGHGAPYAVGTLSSEEPIVHVVPQVIAGADESGLVMWHEGAGATVWFYGSPQPPPPLSVVREEGHTDFLDLQHGKVEAAGLDEDESELYDSDNDEEEDEDVEDEAELYDSDNDEEEDEDAGSDEDEPAARKPRDDESSKKADSLPLVPGPGTVVTNGQLLGPPRFAAVKNTAAFMRLAAAEDDHAEGGREIVVLYRYTRFSRTWSGRRGVEACRQTKLHRLRFAVPPAGDVVGSLAWVGASLGSLIYPALFCRELQEVWTTILAAAPVNIPPRATRLQVMVDAGILRRDDYTAERMDHVRGALETEIQEAWPERCHVGMELNLPEPVPDGHEEEDEDARPTKRRKVADDADGEENECSVCFFPLDRGLAAWPCDHRHVFHGECLEKTLARNHTCPLCRNDLVVR
jgi:hypothetical protein